MEFEINNSTYSIVEVEEKELKEQFEKDYPNAEDIVELYGHTSYVTHIIRINKNLCAEEKIRTLKHELAHVWLWVYAHSSNNMFTEENVCEIVASSNDFINEVVEKYTKLQK